MQAGSVFQAALGVLFLTSWESGNEKGREARHFEVAPQSPALGEASPSALSLPDVAASAPWTAAAVHLALWACLWGCVGMGGVGRRLIQGWWMRGELRDGPLWGRGRV